MKKSMFLKIYIIPIIFFSPLIMMSSNSWFSIWMIMEINLMSFIPLIIFLNKFFKELTIKYFLIQSISSTILLFSSNMMMSNLFEFKLFIILIINMSLLMKIGSPPFHNWFINMMNNMSWMNCFILSTWQKIIPMTSIMYIYNIKLIYIIILISSLLSSILTLNHQSIRIILSFSSINHMSWILMNLMISEWIWMFYFITYSLMNLSIMMIFNKMNIFYINQLYFIKMNKFVQLILLMNFFSISNLPPMLGFSIKLISLFYMNFNMMQIILIILLILSILSFLFYTRICINLMLNYKLVNKNILSHKFVNDNKFIPMILYSLFMNLWIINMWML